MERKIEDILSGESPQKELDNEAVNDTKKFGERMLKILQSLKTAKLPVEESVALWSRIEETSRKSKQRKYHIVILTYGAAACLLLALSVVLWNSRDKDTTYDSLLRNAMEHQSLIRQEEAISMRQGNGQQVVISDEQIVDLSKTAASRSGQKKTAVFNTLTVPYGKRTEVILPDGSTVWLNAGSQLTFPETFNEDQRQVYLEGEGYFDITPDRQRPFLLHTANMDVKVRGTAFNVRSYNDDADASAVLVHGEIELEGKGETVFDKLVLKPGTTAILHKDSKVLSVSKEAVEDYVSWKEKQLVLKNTPLTEILKRLERIYNTKITAESIAGADETFSGRLDLNQSLTDLLTTLYNPVEYQLEKQERRVFIKAKK